MIDAKRLEELRRMLALWPDGRVIDDERPVSEIIFDALPALLDAAERDIERKGVINDALATKASALIEEVAHWKAHAAAADDGRGAPRRQPRLCGRRHPCHTRGPALTGPDTGRVYPIRRYAADAVACMGGRYV